MEKYICKEKSMKLTVQELKKLSSSLSAIQDPIDQIQEGIDKKTELQSQLKSVIKCKKSIKQCLC